MRNGVLLMGGAALLALVYTGGNVGKLVVMYAINVFAVTFTLSNVAMSRMWIQRRRRCWKAAAPPADSPARYPPVRDDPRHYGVGEVHRRAGG